MIDLLKKKTKVILSRSGFYQKPSFLIIGAQKAGTTSLYEILNQHTEIHGSSPKEVHFFDDEKRFSANYYQYHTHFRLGKDIKLNFEATPRYLAHPDVPRRLHNYNPNLKFVVLLREPSSRALSAWKMFHHEYEKGPFKFLHDPRGFEEAILEDISKGNNDAFSYINFGMYASQIRRYFQHFSSKQFIFLESNELKNNFLESIQHVQHFLGVNYEPLEFLELNKSVSEDEYIDVLYELRLFYNESNNDLYNLIDRKYDW